MLVLIHFNIQFYNFFYMLGVKNYHNLEIFEYSEFLRVLFIYKKLYLNPFATTDANMRQYFHCLQ